MADIEKVIKGIDICLQRFRCGEDCPYYNTEKIGCMEQLREDSLELLKEQKEIKEQFVKAFNTIRDAYNAPANREKILLNYLARNACCCEQKKSNVGLTQ